MHGAGNDFVIIDARQTDTQMQAALARAIGARHFGVGYDQLAMLTQSDGADVDIVFWNSDGSIAGACGNASRCIARLVDPTAGSVDLDGVEIATLPEAKLRPHRRKVQIVFQDPYRSLNPRRKIGLSLIEAPVNFGVPKDEAIAAARDLMELVGLPGDSLDRYPHQFSGGQRQRICIARALAVEPELLIADEAVSALDVSVQAQVLELLDDIRERYNLAMLFITHDLRVAAQICDRLIVMKKGVVVEQGKTKEVYSNPQDEYTRLLLDAAPGQNVDFGSGIAG